MMNPMKETGPASGTFSFSLLIAWLFFCLMPNFFAIRNVTYRRLDLDQCTQWLSLSHCAQRRARSSPPRPDGSNCSALPSLVAPAALPFRCLNRHRTSAFLASYGVAAAPEASGGPPLVRATFHRLRGSDRRDRSTWYAKTAEILHRAWGSRKWRVHHRTSAKTEIASRINTVLSLKRLLFTSLLSARAFRSGSCGSFSENPSFLEAHRGRVTASVS